MKYLLMIYGNEERWTSIPADVLEKEVAEQDAWNSRHRASGELLAAYGLGDRSEATLVQNKDGVPFSTDGPYLESKEYVCSFYILHVESAERAREIAAEMPWTSASPVELWPILHDGFAPKPDEGAGR
ncbi:MULTISPECIES: YciI family protein [unclassified Streptomyces]|uniref:YciI family protein n=1 Tax=unclassified Streptomyces TaxID=2593676 RepID=UPI000CD56E39|nr:MULTISPECIES: YciI family protein [unclassified Streptomyces]